MYSMEVERLSNRARELPRDTDRLLWLKKGFSRFSCLIIHRVFFAKCVWGLILKPPTHESTNGFLHLLLFLKPVQPPVVKTENIAQQQAFPEIQFCRTKPPEGLVLCVMDAFSAHSLSFDKLSRAFKRIFIALHTLVGKA